MGRRLEGKGLRFSPASQGLACLVLSGMHCLLASPVRAVYEMPLSSRPEHTSAGILALLLARTSVRYSPGLSYLICKMGQQLA